MTTIATTRRRIKRHFQAFEKYEREKQQLVDEIVQRLYSSDPDATLKAVAERAGICVSTLSRLNKGKTFFPRFDTLWKMARASGMRFDVEQLRKSGQK